MSVFYRVHNMSNTELPADVESLRALLLKAQAELASLRHHVAVLSKMIFGPRSERRPVEAPSDGGQMWFKFAMLLEDAQRTADRTACHGAVEILSTPQAPPKPRGRRATFPEHLPRVRTTIELPAQDRQCCGLTMEPMGHEITKELERIEMAVVHEIARTKYCCRACQRGVAIAPAPTRAISKGMLGHEWLTRLLVERFGNHMPYHRLEKKYQSEGIDLSRSVLCRSALELADKLTPIYEALRAEVVSGDVLFADETTVPVQESKKGGPRRAHVWLYASKSGDMIYDYHESRGPDSPSAILKDFRGYLHDDGYQVYQSALDPEKVKHVACWAHVRRKFVDCEDFDPLRAREAIGWMRQLFALERFARARSLTASQIRELRAERAPAILSGFYSWLGANQEQVPPRGGMGKAIAYALRRWEAMQTFLEDGRLELDNNRSERALRAVAVGRKNWIQVGNERGGKGAAVCYSLIGSCKARGIDPMMYLRDVILRVAEGVEPKALTPAKWKDLYAAEVEDRRTYVMGQMLTALRN